MLESTGPHDTPVEPLPENVVPFSRRLMQMDNDWVDLEGDEELGPQLINDVDFAQYQLRRWTSPGPARSLTVVERIIADINAEPIQDEADEAEPTQSRQARLLHLLRDPKYTALVVPGDPNVNNFKEAFERAVTDEQRTAIQAIHQLYRIGISNELIESTATHHAYALIKSILSQRPNLSIVEDETPPATL